MNFKQLANERRSIRSFCCQKVPDVLIQQMIEAAMLAPSACNYQPWYYIIVDDPKLLESIHAAYPREWFAKAQQIIVICGDHQKSWKRSYDAKDHCDIDIAITVDHLTLMATELGIGTCWVCHFDPEKVKNALQLPSHIEPVVLIPFGYPADSPSHPVKSRKPANELVYRNGFKR
jgi:nitroreductase